MSEAGAQSVFERMVASIGERSAAIGSRPIVSFWPHLGSDGRRLLIVGQAVYGWADDWRAADATNEEGRARVVEMIRVRNAGIAEPMAWIDQSDRRDKPFWRSCRMLAEQLIPDSSAPWWGRFTWANLYPVAWEADPDAPPGSPASHPDNPGGPLKLAQDPFVAEILVETVEWIDPEIVVVFGGPLWWPAAAAAPDLTERPRPLMQAGRVGGRRWVVGWHPNGANRRGWTPERYVPLIVETLSDV